jgi:hypothetical protein
MNGLGSTGTFRSTVSHHLVLSRVATVALNVDVLRHEKYELIYNLDNNSNEV